MSLKRRAPLRSGTKKLRRTRLKPVSAKRHDEGAVYAVVKLQVWERDEGRCQAQARGLWPELECGGPLDPHHIWPKGRYGPMSDPDNLIVLCRVHHIEGVHGHTRLARERGLLRDGPKEEVDG